MSMDIPFNTPRYTKNHNIDGWPICDGKDVMTKDEVITRLNQVQESSDVMEGLLNCIGNLTGVAKGDTAGLIQWVDVAAKIQGDCINRLKGDAARFEQEAKASTDKFNKGYFEGKAEQCLKLADALQHRNPGRLGDDF